MAAKEMTSDQFKALARMDSVELGQLASMALMVVAVKTERDYVEVIRELADVVDEKHEGPEAREELRRAVEQAMYEDDPEQEPRHDDVDHQGPQPPVLRYAIVLQAGVWAMAPNDVLDMIERAAQDARDHLLAAYEANRDQVRADFPRIVPNVNGNQTETGGTHDG